MKFVSTRSTSFYTGTQAIRRGLAADGGLIVPSQFPQVTQNQIQELRAMDYAQRAAWVLGLYLPEYGDLSQATAAAYGRFDEGDAAPLVMVDQGLYCLELWHGPTAAFKDIALTILPHLLARAKILDDDPSHTLVLVATSGDTGKAALEGFVGAQGIDIAVLYPEHGVSTVQKLQMMTTEGDNVHVAGVRGNFDDAQRACKRIFADQATVQTLRQQGVELSSANSINLGRLLPQIAYYFSAYADLLDGEIALGDRINFCVPCGNFGNILAAYYAHRMGLPISRLIVASNANNVLSDFFDTGTYDARRELVATTSPSMDILVSSNLERLIFELADRDCALTSQRMAQLTNNGTYALSDAERQQLGQLFWAGYASEEAVADCIEEVFDVYGYIADPHTAVALSVWSDYVQQTNDQTPTVVVSTASPYKFCDDVLRAVGAQPSAQPAKSFAKLRDLTALPIPDSLARALQLPILHTQVIAPEDADQWATKLLTRSQK